MARPLRLHVPGGFYHVTLRGNHRQDIFRSPGDRELLDRVVAETVEELGAQVHAYCWMSNHIHLLIQVSDVPLGRVIHRIASRYARRFQWRLETTGHLFERRYHAVLVDAEAYLLTLVRYIHRNPVRAGIVADPAHYPWSSHRRYLGGGVANWVSTHFALRLFSKDKREAIQQYMAWMGATEDHRWGEGALATNARNPQVMGDDIFLQRVTSRPHCVEPKPTWEDLLSECSRRFNTTPEAILATSRVRILSPARAWLCREALSRGVASTSAISRFLNRSEAAIRGIIARHPLPAPDP